MRHVGWQAQGLVRPEGRDLPLDVHFAAAAGELVELLPGARPAAMPLSIVYPGARLVPQRVRAFIGAMERLRP